jgi:hypothetical protein
MLHSASWVLNSETLPDSIQEVPKLLLFRASVPQFKVGDFLGARVL